MNAQIEITQRALIMYENVVHKGGKVKKFTEKRRKNWLVNLRLRSGGASRIMLMCANGLRYNNILIQI